ncbi:hypothetical protein BJ742DRAFT_784284 [Cladochytrium replicatum]|nr:hypothetical protein BJ742DRAFT_784284 [Cladochytrium replicatum]
MALSGVDGSNAKWKLDAPEFVPGGIETTFTSQSSEEPDLGTTNSTGLVDDDAEFWSDPLFEPISPDDLLLQIFNLPPKEAKTLLEKCGYDLSLAVDMFLRPNNTPPTTTQTPRQICRHYQAGNCYRTDCWYSHETGSTVCKYWLDGACINGDECTFAHGFDVVKESLQRAESIPQKTETPRLMNDADAFPTLPGVRTQSKPTFELRVGPPTTKEDNFPALGAGASQKKSRKGVKVDAALFFGGDTSGGSGGSVAFAAAAKKQSVVAPSSSPKSTPKAKVASESSLPVPKATGVKWLQTGDSVTVDYFKYRQEAIECAVLRNKLFQKATEAYLSGNKSAATNFSKQAHRLNEELQRLHSAASSEIYSARNRQLANASASRTMTSKSGDADYIDLHGLHPDEAVEFLKRDLFALAKSRRGEGTVTVVTGTGHHSRYGRAKVMPAVREYLESARIQFREGSMGDRYKGLFVVNLASIR